MLDAVVRLWEGGGGAAVAPVLESMFTQLVFAHEYRFGLMSRTDVSVTVNFPQQRGSKGSNDDDGGGSGDGGSSGGGGADGGVVPVLAHQSETLTFSCPDASLPYQPHDPTITMLEGVRQNTDNPTRIPLNSRGLIRRHSAADAPPPLTPPPLRTGSFQATALMLTNCAVAFSILLRRH